MQFAGFVGFFKILEKQAAKQTGQYAYGEKESRSTGDPAKTVGGDPAAGNDTMDMGMVEQILPPGVQDGEESDFGTQVRRVGGDDAQRLGCCTEKNAVKDPFVVKSYSGDLFWQGENNMEI